MRKYPNYINVVGRVTDVPLDCDPNQHAVSGRSEVKAEPSQVALCINQPADVPLAEVFQRFSLLVVGQYFVVHQPVQVNHFLIREILHIAGIENPHPVRRWNLFLYNF